MGKDASQADIEAFASKIHDSSEMANFLTGKEGLTQASISSIKAAGDATGQGDKVDAFINGLGNEEGFTNGEALTGALTLTALTGYGANKATKALTGKSLWDRAKDTLSGQDSPSNKQTMDSSTNNNNGNSSGNPKQNPEHNDSFHKDIKNYTEDYRASKELFDKESQNLEHLKDQRERLDEMDPKQASRAQKLDEQILESEKKIAGHQNDMDVAGIAMTVKSAPISILAKASEIAKGTNNRLYESAEAPTISALAV